MQLPHPRHVRENISTGPITTQMTEPTHTVEVRANASAGHLSVHVEGQHPVDVPFMFEQPSKRIAPAALASFISHVLIVVAIVALHSLRAAFGVDRRIPSGPAEPEHHLAQPTGSGWWRWRWRQQDEGAAPEGRAARQGQNHRSSRETPENRARQQAKNEPPPIEQFNIPAKLTAAATDTLPGAIEAPPGPPTLSQGSGAGGGAGTGTGTGIGPGTGSGLGPGSGGGTGGGTYRPGNGVTIPRVLREVKPQYTSDAMRAKVQGTVLLECVVRPDGSVGDVQILRSLDGVFGLDQEAIKAAKQWRFAPGTRLGEPVPVLVTIELTFTLR